MIEKSLIVVKPDGVQRGLVGNIIKRFENVGLKIVAMKMAHISKEFSKKHYKAHVDKPFYKGLETFITQGPVIAFVVEGISAVDLSRKLVGETEPHKALPGTIRGDFAHHTYAFTDKKGIAIKNLIHASGSKKEAEEEIKLWFRDEELFEYKTVHEEHVF